MKQIIKKILGGKFMQFYGLLRTLHILKYNYKIDYNLYKKHSSVFSIDTLEKKEALITFQYHSIEKGLLHAPIRYRFAKNKIEELICSLKDEKISEHLRGTQFQAAISNLCNYYELHKTNKQDISDFFSEECYYWLKGKLAIKYPSTIEKSKNDYFLMSENNFLEFSESRHSVRSFNGEKVSDVILKKVVKLANNAPSVCNRQSISVYILENKEKIDQIVEIQGGLKGFSKSLNQLIILTSNRNYFYSIGERNQLFIDGGIYLMNLLYALHYYQIAACPAHWAMPVNADEKIGQILNLPESLKIICLVGIGIPEKTFPITLSLKRTEADNLRIIK